MAGDKGVKVSANVFDVGNPGDQTHDAFDKNTKRFKDRFEEIRNELDSMMVRCRTGYEEMTYAGELVSTRRQSEPYDYSNFPVVHG